MNPVYLIWALLALQALVLVALLWFDHKMHTREEWYEKGKERGMADRQQHLVEASYLRGFYEGMKHDRDIHGESMEGWREALPEAFSKYK